MNIQSLQEFQALPAPELTGYIQRRKKELGSSLLILTHHYQRPEIVALGDFVGDSFKLAQTAASVKGVKNVVFCGVNFMAEAVSTLVNNDVVVQLSSPTSGCPMADMAEEQDVLDAVNAIRDVGHDVVIPVVYMNSTSEIKAIAGGMGGCVCTSSNADKAVAWALAQRAKVLFLPDEYLGVNTCRKLGLPEKDYCVYERGKEKGSLSNNQIKAAKVLIWNGFCHVHKGFKPEHIIAARAMSANAKVAVHPECSPEVVQMADAVGSTEFLVKYVESQPEGSTVFVGTENNLVRRLAASHAGKRILPLSNEAVCFNMAKNTPAHLACSLKDENLGIWGKVSVPLESKLFAAVALNRMLSLE